MRIAVFGQTGQVATALREMKPDGIDLIHITRDDADFSDPEAPARAVEGLTCDAVINAVAFTAVDRAETEVELADRINHQAVGRLAEVLARENCPFLHVSTDYVFDGSGDQPWQPEDPTGPLGVYGRTKLAGEVAIRAAHGPHTILRTSWVFSATGTNFVRTMLRIGSERETLSVVSDQIGGPTPANAIAGALYRIAADTVSGTTGGTFHFSGQPDISWAGFAQAIFEEARLPCSVTGILTSEYPTPAPRPLNSRLDCESLAARFGIPRPDWREELARVVKELT